jgi:hypothetical protein
MQRFLLKVQQLSCQYQLENVDVFNADKEINIKNADVIMTRKIDLSNN